MYTSVPNRTLRAVLYGGGATLLLLDTIFLLKATFTRNFIPIVPIIAGIFTALGLLLIIHAEQRAREQDKKTHRRIARVSHQLTTPLKMLQDDLNDIPSTTAKLLPADKKLRLKKMATRSTIVLNNIRDIFLILQAQEGKISQVVQTHNICDLLETACQRALPLASAHNTEINLKKLCPATLVKVDKQLFLIAITHLLENAIYYSLTPGKINVDVVKGKKKTRVIIQDRGLGISKADANTIFKPFCRGANATQYEPDGIGIGLALTKLIIHEFKGSITWQNKESGIGTQFEITLPLLSNS